MIYRNVNAILFSNISRKRNNLTRLSCLRSTFWKIPSQHLRHYNDGLKKFTEISNDHLTPELSLHLITPNCEIWHSPATKFHFDNDPFWAIYWPGGQALSRYILDQRQLFQGKNVIDIGSGCGASAIAAAKSGARTVLANDIDNLSMQAIAMNAELNQVELYLENSDIIGKDVDSINVVVNGQIVQPRWDIVLVGDMFYDSEFINKLFLWLNELNSNGKTVLIGDPGRHAFKHVMGREKLVNLASYPGNHKEHFGFDSYSVWKIS